ncbi:hypothetical protein BD311DRAFT_739396 [Dichomitus squalens]|uniref:Uncharacterized protein n=1 Tax=Dichomitus squalens TaxID=114155 RepID=A0A4Q9MLD2_9APHY|nr:hypothetical protein BD311DRAFT_739396 [Dichomitus squalens]
MSLLPSLSWAAFSGYRSYALAKGNAFLGWIVFAMSAMFIMPNIIIVLRNGQGSFPEPLQDCLSWPNAHINKMRFKLSPVSEPDVVVIIPRTIFVMSELVVIALTLNKHNLSRGMSPKGGSALLRILLKNVDSTIWGPSVSTQIRYYWMHLEKRLVHNSRSIDQTCLPQQIRLTGTQ